MVAICHPPVQMSRLVEHQESHSSTVFLSKSMSHSRGVNSARAEQVVGLTLASSLWHKVVGAPWGVATRKSLLWWAVFTLLLISPISYEGTPFATWHTIFIFYFIPPIFNPSFFLETCISFCQNHMSPSISWTVLVNLS